MNGSMYVWYRILDTIMRGCGMGYGATDYYHLQITFIILLFPHSNLCPGVSCSHSTGQYVLERRRFFRNFGAKVSSVGSPIYMLTQLSVHRKLLKVYEPMYRVKNLLVHCLFSSQYHLL
jgi:hypothetical protein